MDKHRRITVADSAPYPPVRVTGENKRLAALLNDAFGGSGGEFNTISEYTYQAIRFKEEYPEYSHILMDIAKVEMKHLFMIGELISMLGGELIYGKYSDGEKIFWSGEDIFYGGNLSAALMYDLRGEQNAYGEYVRLARRSGDRFVFDVLMRIALDEMIHTSIFKGMLHKLGTRG